MEVYSLGARRVPSVCSRPGVGQGVALSNEIIAQTDIGSGRQVRLLKVDVRMYGYILRIRQGFAASPVATQFRTWLLDNVRQTLQAARH